MEVLKILSPHLIFAFRNSQFIHGLEIELDFMGNALEACQHGIITIDLDLKIKFQNKTAVKLLHKYFEPLSDCLPEEIVRYVNHHILLYSSSEIYIPPNPLIFEYLDSKLEIRLSFQSQSQTIVIFLEESKVVTATDLRALGLTQRESAILGYISLRTVHKHRENIFRKLGVETRTAAMLRAFEIIQTAHLQI